MRLAPWVPKCDIVPFAQVACWVPFEAVGPERSDAVRRVGVGSQVGLRAGQERDAWSSRCRTTRATRPATSMSRR
eukprot:436273-Prymnesium_polylepis.1